jgi:hypothetical protein
VVGFNSTGGARMKREERNHRAGKAKLQLTGFAAPPSTDRGPGWYPLSYLSARKEV